MTIRYEKRLWTAKLALLAVGTTMIGLALSWCMLRVALGSAPHRFHQWEWRLFCNEGMIGSPRKQMGADLIAHHLHKGMTRKEVEALLGPSESPPCLREDCKIETHFDHPGPDKNGYQVGETTWSYVLYVYFDSQDKMTEAHMVDED